MTPAYSDALLSLILPRISTFARKLGVEWESPLKPDDVKSFWPCLAPGQNGGVLELKNGYRFTFDPAGYVSSFTAPEWLGNQWSGEEPLRYLGKPTMTTNEIYSLARETLLRLGFRPDNRLCGGARFGLGLLGQGRHRILGWRNPPLLAGVERRLL